MKYRPTYPAAAIDAILDGLGSPAEIGAADIGAGTGISARLLGDRGVRVMAVEPGDAMRAAAAPHANVTWAIGTAEATDLAPASVDLVLCAQSFHWFRAADALAEFARILGPRRRLAIMWNRRSKTDPLTAGYRHVIVDVGGDMGVESMDFDPAVIPNSGLFSSPERLNVSQHAATGPRRARRARAKRVLRAQDRPGRRTPHRVVTALHAAHADADGFVTLVYETEIYRATRL